MTDWYTRTDDIQPSGRVYITLTCLDCGGQVRLAKSPKGEEKAAQMLAEHKPSGCCADRQDAGGGAPVAAGTPPTPVQGN